MERKLGLDALTEAWLAYKQGGDINARNDLILHYGSLVRVVAAKIAAQLPKMVAREDLTSYGTFGLIDAIEKFDPAKQVKFETYAVTRIRGSIFDEIRHLDWVPRTVRAKARDVERAGNELHAKLGRPAEDAEVATHLGITLVELWHIQTQTEAGHVGHFYDAHGQDQNSGMQPGSLPARRAFDPTSNPEDLFGIQEVAEMLASSIDAMPQRFKTILVLYYIHGMTLAEIGEVLGVTESRVCQLQSKLLQTLHESLAQGLATAA